MVGSQTGAATNNEVHPDMARSEDEQLDIRKTFREKVNMQPKEIEDWLGTDESKSVGADSGDGESTGHKSGKKIIEIKRENVDELTEDDYDHMKKVIGYINRHCSQGPEDDIEHSDWRYSLMNWGHDPCADDGCANDG